MIGKHLRDIWKASGRHLGSKGAPRRHPGGSQEAPRGTQEAPRRHPGGTQGHPGHPGVSRRSWEQKGQYLPAKMQQKLKKRPFHEVFLRVGVTKYRAWRQNLSDTLRGRKGASPRALYQNRQNPSDEICLGNIILSSYNILLLYYYIIIRI